MRSSSLSSSIHQTLVSRLLVAALTLSLVFAVLAYYNNQHRTESGIVELARLQTVRFNEHILDLLDRGDVLPAAAILETRVNQFSEVSGPLIVRDGRFVLIRIYDQSGRQILDRSEDDFVAMPAIRQAVDDAEILPLKVGESRVVTTQLEGMPFVGLALPLENSQGSVVAQVVGVFAVSPEAIDTIRGNVLLTMLYVAGLVIATAILIYPIIRGLLDRLSLETVRLLNANLEVLQVLGSAIAKRDSDTDAHNYRVSVYSVCLAKAVALSREQIRSLIKGALLHDVGKLGIRDNILLKPGKLTDEEFLIMKTHVEHGLEITARAHWLKDAEQVVGGHHEKFDGSGYPKGLKADEIPLASRIFAITDVFDALTSRRPYKEPMTFEESMTILEQGRASHFDPELLDVFSTIARDLYDSFSGKDDHEPKERLESYIDEYFKRDVGDLFT